MTDYAALAGQFGGKPADSGTDYAALAAKMGGKLSEQPKAPAYDPTEGNSFLENAAIGGGKALTDLYRGGKQILGIGDQKALQAEIDDAKTRDAPIMRTGGGIVGNLAGNLAATAIPGGMIAKGAMAIPKVGALIESALAAAPVMSAAGVGAAQGAAAGALEPVATGESRGKNVALSAGIGAAGGAIPGLLSRVVSPQTGADATKLIEEGVRLTPGQIMGGMAKSMEDKAMSLPLVGDFIRGARTRSLEDFNRAGFNRALAPIGETVGRDFNIGREGLAAVESKIGQAYDTVLDKIKIVDLGGNDGAFAQDVGKIIGMSAELGEGPAKQLAAIVKNRVIDRMTEAGTMSADTMKSVESELGRQASRYVSSADGAQRGLGNAIREVQASLRRAVEDSAGSDLAGELKNANTAWANFVRLRDAGSRIGAEGGVFTPAQLSAAVRKGDKSVGKGDYMAGDALMQDLTEAGRNVLPSKVPDSGTAGRLLLNGGALGVLPFLDPHVIGGGGAAAAIYTRPGQALIQALLTKRPEFAATLGQILQSGAVPGAIAGGAMAPLLTRP